MKLSKILPTAIVMGLSTLAAQPAFAAYTFVGTADYFSVTNYGANSDFKTSQPSGTGTYTNFVQNTLGANGLPVFNVAFGGPASAAAVNRLGTGELAWWTPGVNNGPGSNDSITVAQSVGGNDVPFTLPFNDSNFFAPTGNGGSNSSAYLTAIFTGTLTLDAISTVTFSLGADDDAFLFVDGVSVLQLGGIHAPTVSPGTSAPLSAGVHTVKLFYADRNQNQAELHFNITAVTNAVPEPTTWAMMVGGLALVGLSMRRRKTNVSFA